MGGIHHRELLHVQSGWNSELHVPSYHPVSLFNGKFKEFPFVWKVYTLKITALAASKAPNKAWTPPDNFG